MFRLLLRTTTTTTTTTTTAAAAKIPSPKSAAASLRILAKATEATSSPCSTSPAAAALDSTRTGQAHPFLPALRGRGFKSGRNDVDSGSGPKTCCDQRDDATSGSVPPHVFDASGEARLLPGQKKPLSGENRLHLGNSGGLPVPPRDIVRSDGSRLISGANQLSSHETRLSWGKSGTASGQHLIRSHLNGFASGYTSRVAGLAMLLLLVAAISPSKGDDDSIFALPDPRNAVSEAWSSILDASRKISTIYEAFSDAIWTSIAKLCNAAKDTVILIRCLKVILFTKGEDRANEFALRWRLKVVSLLADLLSSDGLRRKAVLHANGGAVIDWLLEAVGHGEVEWRMIQDEAARAISYLLSDASTCEELLQRPSTLYHLLLFTAPLQPNSEPKKSEKDLELPMENNSKGQGHSMLVAAIMDIVTSSCETLNLEGLRPKLSRNADVKDISAALKVLEEGALHLDEGQDDSSINTVGVTIIEEKTLVGDQNDQSYQIDETDEGNQNHQMAANSYVWTLYAYWRNKWWNSNKNHDGSGSKEKPAVSTPAGPNDLKRNTKIRGLWDDLHGKYVAVPLAAWAIATWAHASSVNCEKIAELDKNGNGVLAAIMAPERTVKWHGAVTSRLLVENGYEKYVVPWGNALLNTGREVCEMEDMQLAIVILKSFYSCVKRSMKVQENISEESLPILREIAKETSDNVDLQVVVAEVLDVLSFSGAGFSALEAKKWCSILFHWIFHDGFEDTTHLRAAGMLANVLKNLGADAIPLSQAWLAMIIFDIINGVEPNMEKIEVAPSKSKLLVQSRLKEVAVQAANEAAKAAWKSIGEANGDSDMKQTSSGPESDWGDLARLHIFRSFPKGQRKEKSKLTALNTAEVSVKAMKALANLSAEEKHYQIKMLEKGALYLLRRFMLSKDYENSEMSLNQAEEKADKEESANIVYVPESKLPPSVHICRHAARILSILSLQPLTSSFLKDDESWYRWLRDCSLSLVPDCKDLKTCSYASAILYNIDAVNTFALYDLQNLRHERLPWPHYEDRVFLLNMESPPWKSSTRSNTQDEVGDIISNKEEQTLPNDFDMDVVFVHGLCGGPFKTWRLTDDKTSTVTAGPIEKIDINSGREGTCWPKQWLATDLPSCRLLTVRYKTNLSEWSGATLPLQEVSEILLDKLLAAGVGERPVVFITHSMGGLVVKQMLRQAAKDKSCSKFLKQTAGVVFYSCPHFGSKLADMPWRFGLVIRPSPSASELRSGSARLNELNLFFHTLSKSGLKVLSFSETKVTTLVEGYGGWALRMEVVPIESAYPGFGKLVVLDGSDHVNSCKPLNKDDAAYTQTLEFLQEILQSLKENKASR